MAFICTYCGASFTVKRNLTTHLKTAKYCLQRRGIDEVEVKCQYCNKSVANEKYLDKHYLVCINKKLKDTIEPYKLLIADKDKQLQEKDTIISEKATIISEKDAIIADYKAKYEELVQQIAKRPSKMINSGNSIVINYTGEQLKAGSLKELIDAVITNNYIDFINKPVVQDSYKVVDRARRKIVFADRDNKQVAEIGCHKFLTKLFTDLQPEQERIYDVLVYKLHRLLHEKLNTLREEQERRNAERKRNARGRNVDLEDINYECKAYYVEPDLCAEIDQWYYDYDYEVAYEPKPQRRDEQPDYGQYLEENYGDDRFESYEDKEDSEKTFNVRAYIKYRKAVEWLQNQGFTVDVNIVDRSEQGIRDTISLCLEAQSAIKTLISGKYRLKKKNPFYTQHSSLALS